MRNVAPAIRIETPANLRLDRTARPPRLVLGGEWIVAEAERMDETLRALSYTDIPELAIDGLSITALDSAGAWLILRTSGEL